MKPLALVLLGIILSTTGFADILPGHYSGGIISARCPVKVGGQITFDVALNGIVHAYITDDGTLTATLVGQMDSRGRFFAEDTDTRLVGTARFYNRGQYIVITGTGKDENCTYKFQGRFRHF